MRVTTENENPAPRGGGNGALVEIDQAGNQTRHINTQSAPPGQAILTAILAGTLWRLKSLHGEAVELLPAVFGGRLEALGAGVLLAERCGARLMP